MFLFVWREVSCSFLKLQVQISLAHIFQEINQILKLALQDLHELSLLLETHLLVLSCLVFLIVFLLERPFSRV